MHDFLINSTTPQTSLPGPQKPACDCSTDNRTSNVRCASTRDVTNMCYSSFTWAELLKPYLRPTGAAISAPRDLFSQVRDNRSAPPDPIYDGL